MTIRIVTGVLFRQPNRQRLTLTPLVMLMVALSMVLTGSKVRADVAGPVPSEELRPQDVVMIVVDALQSNAEDSGDDGIATVFKFASPANRSNTGPLERFTRMIKSGFSDMLNHQGARFSPMEISDDVAVQAVWLLTLSGAEVGYAFQLRKQNGGEFSGMWMTETVVPLGESPQSGTRI